MATLRSSFHLALLALFGLSIGCGREIGIACERATDCSLRGDRQCDLSVRIGGKGECTIEGCGRNSCPDEATCVQTYASEFLTTACDPEREDRAAWDGAGQPLEPRDDCGTTEVCLPEGLCADQQTARTSCRRKCKDDDECRGDYECRWTGARGVYRAVNPDDPADDSQIRICMPR